MQDDTGKQHIRELQIALMSVTTERNSALARVERLEAALLNIYQVWQIRSELFTNDEDCAASLADRARAAFGDATSHPPQQPEPQTGLSEG